MILFGAATDYCLFLIARYREELHRHDDRREALRVAWRGAAPAVAASGTIKREPAASATAIIRVRTGRMNPPQGQSEWTALALRTLCVAGH